MKTKLATILTALGLCICSTPAKANLITQTQTILGGEDFTFQRFDKSLGSLTEVSFNFSGLVGTHMVLSNPSQTTGTLNATLSVDDSVALPLSGGGTLTVVSMASPFMFMVTLAAGDGPLTLSASDIGNSLTVNLLGSLGDYEGTAGSMITFPTTDESLLALDINGLTADITFQDTETMNLEYQYTPGAVPEPSSGILASTILLGVALFARKRITWGLQR